MKSHWASYREEKVNAFIHEDENGFVSVRESGEWFYVEDVYIVKEKRDKGIMKTYEKIIIEEGKKRGFKKLGGTVHLSFNNTEESLLVFLKIGWKIVSVINDAIDIEKEI